MRVSYDVRRFTPCRNTVLAIGVFDGVHRAHRTIIQAAIRHARRIKGSAVVMTFWPHPRGYKSLYSLEHRLRILEQLGVDACIVVAFTRPFARLSPEVFADRIIRRYVRPRSVYVGENFRFGSHAAGDAALLAQLLKPHRVAVRIFKTLKVGGAAVSSSHIRSLISSGHLVAARRLLLEPVSVYGHVVRGTGLGRKLGFPTANIDPHHEVTPPSGIYAVRVLYNGISAHGICYIGTRPTFTSRAGGPIVEVHIFNCKRDLYGMYLQAQFIAKIRDQKHFATKTLLIEQIKRDIVKAKKILQ